MSPLKIPTPTLDSQCQHLRKQGRKTAGHLQLALAGLILFACVLIYTQLLARLPQARARRDLSALLSSALNLARHKRPGFPCLWPGNKTAESYQQVMSHFLL